jgi:chromosome segregation ATPase
MSVSIADGNSDLALIAKGGEEFQKRLRQLEAAKAELEQAKADARAAHDAVRITEQERQALKLEWAEIERVREAQRKWWDEAEAVRAVWLEYETEVEKARADCDAKLAENDAELQRINGQA